MAVVFLTDSEEANRLVAEDPMALLVGFALDQQVTVQKAFLGPLEIKHRLGALDARTLADADLEATFATKPAIHRYPGSMGKRVHQLAAFLLERYDGDAAVVWTGARDTADLRARLLELPGFGEMKVKSLAAVLARRFGVSAAEPLVPDHPTLGDVASAQDLADYQAAKKQHKREWNAVPLPPAASASA